MAFLFFAPPAEDPAPPGPALVERIRASTTRTLRAYAPLWARSRSGAAYTALYVTTVESPLEGYDLPVGRARRQLREAEPRPRAGGRPWQWANPIAPAGLVDPPSWAVTATWSASR